MNARELSFTFALVLGLGLTLALFWLMGHTGSVYAGPSVRYVAPGGTDGSNACTTSGHPCATVQHTVDVAGDGDEILVAAGIYTGIHARPAPPGYSGSTIVTQVVFISKTVTVRGGYRADFGAWDPALYATTLDAEGGGRVIFAGGEITPTLEGLRLTGGDADGLGGGGVYVLTATATLSGCQVTNNMAGYGGGVYLGYSDNATLSGNTVLSNAARYSGGGVYLGYSHNATLSGNTVLSNTVSGEFFKYGGGVSLYRSDNVTLSGNTIRGNLASGVGCAYGGGVYLGYGDNAALSGNTILSNTVRDGGGGVYLEHSDNATLSGNTILSNTAQDDGGGIYLENSDNTTLSGNTIIHNTASGGIWTSIHDGGGISVKDSADTTLSGNIIISNTARYGGGVHLRDSDNATLSGNTIWNNTAYDGGGVYLVFSDDVALSGNIVLSNTAWDGGGVSLYRSANAALSGNIIRGNSAQGDGGGVYLERGDDTTLDNNVVADNWANNRGSGLYILGSSSQLLYTSIARNGGGDGSGVYLSGGSSMLINTILVSHTVGLTRTAGNTTRLDGVLWYGNEANTGGSGALSVTHQITGEPAFVDPGAGDYHITSTSAARDTGVASVAGVSRDIDGQVRPMDAAPDLGADEFPGVGLEVVKRPSVLYPDLGQMFAYTLVITSAGVNTATRVLLTDTLPAPQQAVAIVTSWGSCTPGASWGGETICDLGTMGVGDSAYITLTVRVSTSATPGQAMVNRVVVVADETTNRGQATTYAQDCHVRIHGAVPPTEYDSVQAAADAANPGDLIKVAGVCVGVSERERLRQQVYLDKNLTLRGGYTLTNWMASDPVANPTTLDALGQGRVLYITGDITPRLEGLHIVGGDATGLGGSAWGGDAGGGIYLGYSDNAMLSGNTILSNTAHNGGGVYLLHSANAMLSGNIILSNTASSGGGVYPDFSDNVTLSGNTLLSNTASSGGGVCLGYSHNATLSGNIVRGNTAQDDGGGVLLEYSANATLSGNVVRGNSASSGGGIYLNYASDDATLSSNTILSNTASSGGGVFLDHNDNATLSGNAILSNTAGSGGGVFLEHSANAALSSNTILSNTASSDGGGVYLYGGGATLGNNVIADNRAGTAGSGVYVKGSTVHLRHTTLACNGSAELTAGGSDGNGLYVTYYRWDYYGWWYAYSTVALTNTVLVSHMVGITVTAGNTVILDGVLWYGNGANTNGLGTLTATHAITGDPAFAADGYHLTVDSAAIDAGVEAGIKTDVDHEPRPYRTPDLGADEYWPPGTPKRAYLPVVLQQFP